MVETSSQIPNFNLPKLYNDVSLSLENPIFSVEKLEHPPSLDDGLALQTERDLRFMGCQLIQYASILLRLPQVAAATGQVLYNRYYYARSFVRSNFKHTAMACVYLACKIEEAPRRVRDVINVFHHINYLMCCREGSERKGPVPMVLDQHYVALKNDVIKAERRVLKELGFCVHVKHPHKLIYVYLKALDHLDNADFLQKAWNYMNDSLRTDVFMRYSPETIACACVFSAAKCYKIDLPMKRPWWQLFDATDESIMHIVNLLSRMYDRGPINWSATEKQLDALRDRFSQSKSKDKGGEANVSTGTRKEDGAKKKISSKAESSKCSKSHRRHHGKPH